MVNNTNNNNNPTGPRQPAVKKTLYRPLEGSDGKREAVVLQLQKLGIKGSSFGVVNYQPLYDGALSITFSSDAHKENFEKEIIGKGAAIQVPNQTVVPH